MGGRGALWAMLATLAVLLGACAQPRAIAAPEGVRLTPLRTISTLEARVLIRLSGVRGVPVSHAVDCYRMEHPAAQPDGTIQRLSGLLALPRDAAPRRLVSFQHGTSTRRSAVPSAPDGTGLAAAIAFAGNGYMLVAPDYPGLGVSPGRHRYYVTDETGRSVVAMIAAAQRITAAPDTPVFLAGFSQGGHASLAALGILEAEGRPVLGAALAAGAYDLRRISLPAAMKGGAPSHRLYLAYLAWAYADRYGQPLASVLTPELVPVVERLFAEGAGTEAILKALPAEPRAMFAPAFVEAFDRDRPHWFLNALAANGLTDVRPHAPVRLYYGEADRDVVPAEALTAVARMRSKGADARAEDVGPVGHDASMLAAAPKILGWLGELEVAAEGVPAG